MKRDATKRAAVLPVARTRETPRRSACGDSASVDPVRVHYAAPGVLDVVTICGVAGWADATFETTDAPVDCQGCLAVGRWALDAGRP